MAAPGALAITIRRARESDRSEAARIIADPPGDEAVGFCGDPDLARRIGVEPARMGVSMRLEQAFVAEIGGRVVGVMDAGAHGSPSVGIGNVIRVLPVALRIGGPLWMLRTLMRQRLRSRVEFETPRGSYVISELDVDAAYRNHGIGGALLQYAEDDARGLELSRMSLTTSVTNPARRLYERKGYRVVAEKHDPDYEQVTGIPGRVLMVKELPSA